MATRGSYVHISMGEFSGASRHPDNVSFMQFSTKIDGFEQKDSQGLRTHTTLIPIREIFHFHHLPKLYFGFNYNLNIS